MKKRAFIAGLGGIIAASGLGLAAAWKKSGALPALKPLTKGEWSNWSRLQFAKPADILQPSDAAGLANIVAGATRPLRVVGSGHSFTPLIPTSGTIINLDKMSGVISVDQDAQTAWVHAGSRLKDLSPALEAHGLAFKNLGDINEQSIAGAAGTATHGTGKTFKCLSGEILGAKLLTADGSIITADETQNTDILKAAQVSLGALGILTEVKLSLRPRFKLHRKTWVEPLQDTLQKAQDYWDQYRNFEFYSIPYSGHTICIAHDITEEAPTQRNAPDDTSGVMELKQLRDFVRFLPETRRKLISESMAAVPSESAVDESWRLLSTVREVRFNEMEYHLPPDVALDVLDELVRTTEKQRPDIFFPMEVRCTAGDEAWLSPFQNGGRISIAVHAYYKDTYDWFFSHAEPLFREAGGRPHWGKLHSLKFAELNELYPDFGRFCDLREKLDPQGVFMNDYLNGVLRP